MTCKAVGKRFMFLYVDVGAEDHKFVSFLLIEFISPFIFRILKAITFLFFLDVRKYFLRPLSRSTHYVSVKFMDVGD